MTKYIAPRKSIQLTVSIAGDSFLLEDGCWGSSITAVGETVGMSSKSIGSLLNKNDPKALACKAFLCEDVAVEGANKPVTLVKSPGIPLIWLMVVESSRIASAKRDRAASLLAAFTADKIEDIHSQAWGKSRSHQESLEYRTETQRHIETALGLYRIWVECFESSRSATLPEAWSGKRNGKKRSGVFLTEDMWKTISWYGGSYRVKVPGKEDTEYMTYEQVKAQGLLDQPVFGIPYFHLKEALKYTLQQLSLEDRVKNIPRKYWSHGLLEQLFQDAEGFDKAQVVAEKRAAKLALLDIAEDEVLALEHEEGQPLPAKKKHQLVMKELRRLEVEQAVEEERVKRLREDYGVSSEYEELSNYMLERWQPPVDHSIKTPGVKLSAEQLAQYFKKQEILRPESWFLNVPNGNIIGVMHDINNWTWKPVDESHAYWVLTTDISELWWIVQND